MRKDYWVVLDKEIQWELPCISLVRKQSEIIASLNMMLLE